MTVNPASIKDRIQSDMKTALKARHKSKLGALRLILAAIKQIEIDKRITLDDETVIGVLDKMLKQRKESIAQYQTAERDDLADAEAFEIDVIKQYLPSAFSTEEVEAMIVAAVSDSAAGSIKDMGRVMAKLKPQMQGRADMAQVSARVKKLLSE